MKNPCENRKTILILVVNWLVEYIAVTLACVWSTLHDPTGVLNRTEPLDPKPPSPAYWL